MKGLRHYPAGADAEVIAALRYALEKNGWQPGDLDERAGLLPGAVGALLAGQVEAAGPVLRRICHALLIPRWLFHLTGAVVLGADLGHGELGLLLAKRQRMLTGNPDRISDVDLVVEAVEILFAIGGKERANEIQGRNPG